MNSLILDSLKHKKDFKLLFNEGIKSNITFQSKNLENKNLSFIKLIHHSSYIDLDHKLLYAFSISKKTCNAVQRNRIKRRMRAVLSKLSKENALIGMYIIFKLDKSALYLSFNQLCEVVLQAIKE